MKNDGLYRVLVRCSNARKDGCRALYVKMWLRCFESSLKFAGRNDIMFSMARENASLTASCPNMTTKYIRTCWNEVKKAFTGSRDSGNMWVENSDRNAKSFVCCIHLFSGKTAKEPKSTELVAYPAYCVLLNALIRTLISTLYLITSWKIYQDLGRYLPMDSSPYHQFNANIKQKYKRTLQKKNDKNDGTSRRDGKKLGDDAVMLKEAGW